MTMLKAIPFLALSVLISVPGFAASTQCISRSYENSEDLNCAWANPIGGFEGWDQYLEMTLDREVFYAKVILSVAYAVLFIRLNVKLYEQVVLNRKIKHLLSQMAAR